MSPSIPSSSAPEPAKSAKAVASMPTSTAALLEQYRIPGHDGLYVIGSFDRKTSLYFQQVRALNLIWLLSQSEKLQPGTSVCILGGGIAGVSAAAGLLSRGQGCVTLLEKGAELLALQRHNHTRRIHPHLYSWPEAGAENPHAGLPLLDWQAGISADVAAGWTKEFDELRQVTGFSCRLQAAVTGLEAAETAYRVEWEQAGRLQAERFDLVILALGVGAERTVVGLPLHSYWEDDALYTGDVLVSGCGEGGLLEVLRLRLRDFQPEGLAALASTADPELRSVLLAWEAAAVDQPDPAAFLTRQYLALDLPGLDRALAEQLRPGLALTLHGPHPNAPLNVQGTILNRLLVARLLSIGALDYLGGMQLLEARPVNRQLEACFSDGSRRCFDAVLVRHGASSALKKNFASLWEQALAPRTEGTDPTLLLPLWPEGFYS